MNAQPCNHVVTIPQFQRTCWFNALLMALFYSAGMRAYLLKHLHKSPLHKTNKPLYHIFMDILKNRYTKHDDKNNIFFDKLRPEHILSMLHNVDKNFFKNTATSGGFGEWYFVKLMEYFGLGKNVLYVKQQFQGTIFTDFTPDLTLNTKGRFNRNRKTMTKNPPIDVIVVTNPIERLNLNKYFTTKNVVPIQSLYDGVYLKLHGVRYKLDSMLLANWNYRLCKLHHQIAGVTCNHHRYIYNGWTRNTMDPALVGSYSSRKKPCELMKFDWFKDKSEFCLNSQTCKLNFNPSRQKDMCFTVGSYTENVTYIYVRVDENKDNTLVSHAITNVSVPNKQPKFHP